MAQDPYLPAGCTNAEIDLHMGGDIGEEECETCEGEGWLKEDGEDIECPDCDGRGYNQFSISERKQEAREQAQIDAWEDSRYER